MRILGGETRVPIASLTHYSEASYTASATITAEHLPLKTIGVQGNSRAKIYLRADIYNNGGQTTSLNAVFSDGTATVTTTSTAYVTLSTIVDVPTPVVDSDFELTIDVSGGTAFIKNVTALLVLEEPK